MDLPALLFEEFGGNIYVYSFNFVTIPTGYIILLIEGLSNQNDKVYTFQDISWENKSILIEPGQHDIYS